MRRALILILALSVAAALASCARPSTDECENACVKLKSLAKADYDKRTAEAPEELAREGWNSSAPVIDELVAGCTAACVQAGDTEMTQCLANAADADAWKSCLKDPAK